MSEHYVDGGGNIPVRIRELAKSGASNKMCKALEEIAELGRKSYADGSNAIRMGRIAEVALSEQAAPVTRGPDCACCEQQPRKDCTVPGCAMKHAEWALPAPQTVAWRTDFENAPSEAYEFFLVRPQGNHPGRGGPFHPTIVQRIDGKFYTSDNELDPIYFGQDEPDDSPMKTTLEWKPLPADWLTTPPLSHWEGNRGAK